MITMEQMTDSEWRAFVSAGTRTGKVATVRTDGAPHVTPVWFLLDGDDLVFTTGADTVKGKALRRDPRVTLCVDDDRPPYAFVVLTGRAAISEDPGELRRWATELAGRYMGSGRAEEYGERNAVPGELLVRVRIDKIVAIGGVAD
jgi:PPOX class probable F420-dependent enzyme